jgi:hypothetical protein
MPFYAGFDTKSYPGIEMLNWLSAASNLKWCGYYLAPAPNRPPSGWVGQYVSLRPQWGILPIYVGQQDPRTATGAHVPSSILTSAQGETDGVNAADLAASDLFPRGTFVYLDWEYGGLDNNGSEYVKAWITAVIHDARTMAGIYCSYVAAPKIAALIDTIDPIPMVRFWCWKVASANAHPFGGNLASTPTIDPSGCGFPGAQSWQREQNAIVTFPEGAPIDSLQLDFSTSSLADPGAPI